MLLLKEWWRKVIASRLNPFRKKPPVPSPPPPPVSLCTVTFLYDVKGIIGSGKNKIETVLAWVPDTKTHDCAQLFNPPGIGKGVCTIKEIIVYKIPTVTPKKEDE